MCQSDRFLGPERLKNAKNLKVLNGGPIIFWAKVKYLI
jgi:hypothetical protein